MSDPVNPSAPPKSPERRRYNAAKRQESAALTRQSIVDAARTLFLERGYTSTTMPAIAKRAGVAVDTVYAVVGPKPALFRLLIELAISGDSTPIPALQRSYVQEIAAEPDPRRKIARFARATREIQSRLAPLFSVLRDAARTDPELFTVWHEIADRRARNMRLFITDLAATGALRPDLTIDLAADLIWSTNGPEFFTLLVTDRAWPADQFEHHLADLWTRLLLADPSR